MPVSSEPGTTTSHKRDLQLPLRQITTIEIGDLEFAPWLRASTAWHKPLHAHQKNRARSPHNSWQAWCRFFGDRQCPPLHHRGSAPHTGRDHPPDRQTPWPRTAAPSPAAAGLAVRHHKTGYPPGSSRPGPQPKKDSANNNDCAIPAGIGCSTYTNRSPHWLPSPNNWAKRGRSAGALIIKISRTPASINTDRG